MIGKYYLDDFDNKLTLIQKIELCKTNYILTTDNKPNTIYLHINKTNDISVDAIPEIKIKFGRFVPKNIIWVGVDDDNSE